MGKYEGSLRASLAARERWQQSASSSSDGKVLHFESLQLFGRSDVERLEAESISSVQEACDVPESVARARLKEARWGVKEAAELQSKKAAVTAAAPSVAFGQGEEEMASSAPALRRQTSFRDRFEEIQSIYAPLMSDVSHSLQCVACGDRFQLREVCGQICVEHVMCVQCWRRMLSTHVVSQGDSFVRCAGGAKCPNFVEEGLLMTLLSSVDYASYRRRLQDSFIQLQGWRWCINAQCDKVARATDSADAYATMSCACYSLFCVSCGAEGGHWPISCSASARYAAASRAMRGGAQNAGGAAGYLMMEIQYKQCPKCKSP